MIKKTVIASGEAQPMNKKAEFPKGTRFKLDNHLWIVTEATYSDNTEMRKIVAENGDIEILTLETLYKDMSDASFEFLPERD